MRCFAFYKAAHALRKGILVPEFADVLHMIHKRPVTGLYVCAVIVGSTRRRARNQGTSQGECS
jgi:hypothetical protein